MIEVENLTCGYYSTILEGANFFADDSEFVCISGNNGSGKSTLLNAIARIEERNLFIDEKSIIKLNGKPFFANYSNRKEFAQKISYLVQNENCVWNYRVKDFVVAGRYPYTSMNGNYSAYDYEFVKEILEKLEILHLLNREIFSLSGGEFQRVRIARVLVQDTPIVLLDEPASSVDFSFTYSLLKFFKSLAKEKNKTIIASVHDLNTASIFADRISFIIDKKIISDTPEKIMTPKILQQIYNADIEVFEHPKFGCPQAYIN